MVTNVVEGFDTQELDKLQRLGLQKVKVDICVYDFASHLFHLNCGTSKLICILLNHFYTSHTYLMFSVTLNNGITMSEH